MSDFKFAEIKRKAQVSVLDHPIGTATVLGTSKGIAVKGHYEWPPDAPAEVGFSFAVDLVTQNTCKLDVDWPGLLASPIHDPAATFISILVLGRPGLLITAGKNNVSFFYTGPFGSPVVTGCQISVTEPNSSAVMVLRFWP